MGLPRAKCHPCFLLDAILSCFFLFFPQTVFAVNAVFTYDAAGRLLTAQYGDGQYVAYLYDFVGNITQQIASGAGGGGWIGLVIQLLLVN